MRQRTWNIEDLKAAIKSSGSFRQAIQKLGLNGDGGGNNSLIKHIVVKERIDTSHFTGQGYLKGKKHNWTTKIPLKDILKNGVRFNTNSLKKRLYKEGVFSEICSKCGLSKTWMGKPIVLQLDHINGNATDNRIDNLEILCPNCHSQTTTYCRKKKLGDMV